MSTAYSLNNLLLDDPPLDCEALLGPVVSMRWMNNLCRLALLEELDFRRAKAGEHLEHQAEIRRLRRMSMHPSAGRYYPVDGKTHQFLRDVEPEQAAQLVDAWRARQPVPDYADPDEVWSEQYAELPNTDDEARNTHPSPVESEDPESEINIADLVEQGARLQQTLSELRRFSSYDSPGDVSEFHYRNTDAEIQSRDDSFAGPSENTEYQTRSTERELPLDDDPESEILEIDFPDPDQLSSLLQQTDRDRLLFYGGPGPDPLIDSRAGPVLRSQGIPKIAGAALLTLLAALLGLAATWFLIAATQSPPSKSAPIGITSPTKIVPSAVPLASSAPDISDGEFEKRRPNSKPVTPNSEP